MEQAQGKLKQVRNLVEERQWVANGAYLMILVSRLLPSLTLYSL
jgi:hypothetical protein